MTSQARFPFVTCISVDRTQFQRYGTVRYGSPPCPILVRYGTVQYSTQVSCEVRHSQPRYLTLKCQNKVISPYRTFQKVYKRKCHVKFGLTMLLVLVDDFIIRSIVTFPFHPPTIQYYVWRIELQGKRPKQYGGLRILPEWQSKSSWLQYPISNIQYPISNIW